MKIIFCKHCGTQMQFWGYGTGTFNGATILGIYKCPNCGSYDEG